MRLFRPVRAQMALVVLSSCLFAGFNVTAPKFLGDATDVVVDGFISGTLNQGKLVDILGIAALMYLGASLFNWVQGFVAARAVGSVCHELRSAVQQKIERTPTHAGAARETAGQATGTLAGPVADPLSRATHDVDTVSQALGTILTQLITSVLMLLGALGLMLAISLPLAAIVLVSVPLSAYLAVLIGRASHGHFQRQGALVGELYVDVAETVRGQEVIRSLGWEARAQARFEETNQRLTEASGRSQFLSGLIAPLLAFVGNLNYVAVAVVGALQVAGGAMSIGGIQAFLQFTRLFSQPVGQIGGMAATIHACGASAARIFELLDSEEELNLPMALTIAAAGGAPCASSGAPGEIRFDKVDFSYGARKVVKDFSLTVPAGKTVAIVGGTGAGKTSVVNLLLRFLDPESGSITLGGVDISTLGRDAVRGTMALVLQDAWLFSGTIRDNIAYGREGATHQDVVAAAEASHVDHFIRSLPDGYDTMVDAAVDSLSQGQRQLLAIARAHVADREILVHDEASSSVDSRTELQIRRAMQDLRKARTAIVVAHRLSTIADADLIVVMDNGRIVEQGMHSELIQRGGAYSRLHAAQSAQGHDAGPTGAADRSALSSRITSQP